MDIETLCFQFGASYGIALRNLEGVSHSESLTAPQPGGNCLNWVVGHLLASRSKLLELLGQQRIWNAEEVAVYERGSEPIGPDNARPFEELRDAYQSSQEALLDGLRTVPRERLSEPAPFSPGGRQDESFGSLLALFAVHEAYHVGQTGVLRRIAGHPGAMG